MIKKKYKAPQTEVLTMEVEDSFLRASNVTFRDPNTGETDKQPIEDNGDDDFWAGAKKHAPSNNFWEDRVGY